MFTAQLVCQGACRQIDILRAFGVSANSVRRSVEKYRQAGAAGFYGTRKARGPTVMTVEVTAQAQQLLSGNASRREVVDQLGVRYDTLRKAINQGRCASPAIFVVSGFGPSGPAIPGGATSMNPGEKWPLAPAISDTRRLFYSC